jgi:hypothetical protein
MKALMGEVDDQIDSQISTSINAQQQSSTDMDQSSSSGSTEDIPLMAEF